MMKSKFCLIIFMGMVWWAVVPLDAGDNQVSEREKLDRLQENIRQEEKRLEELRANEKSIFGQLRYLDALVALQRRRSAALNNEWDLVEKHIAEIDKQRAEMDAKLAGRRELLARRFRRMYIDGASGTLEVLLTAESFPDLSVREVYYSAMVTADSDMIRTFMEDIAVLKQLRSNLEQEKSKLATLLSDINEAKSATEKERVAKEDFLRAVHEDRLMHEAALKELETASRRIGGIIASYEERARQAQAALAAQSVSSGEATVRGKGTAPSTGPTPIEGPAQPLKPVMEPIPDTGFGMNAGRMCAPCRGNLVQPYGIITNPQFGTKTFSKGVALSATEGSAVRGVWDGEVIFAGWFQGYGRMVILSHGDRYYTLYAHLSDIAAEKGMKVSRGQVIGYVGDTGSLEGPRLYFEVRRGAGSLNPMSWINLGCGG